MKYAEHLKNEIIDKINKGGNKKSISRKYNIPRSTIRYWHETKDIKKEGKIEISNIDPISYSYILGVYLGDGHIDKMKRTYRLRIALDSRQDLVIEECAKNLEILFPSNKIKIDKIKNTNSVIIKVYSSCLPTIFPQYGKGAKHNRNIILTDEQEKIIINDKLMLGLFHTDGSFFVVNGKYPRYQFTNKSKQILDIFGKCLIYYGITPKIRKRKNGVYDIQIQNRKDFDKLYDVLGEKYNMKKWIK